MATAQSDIGTGIATVLSTYFTSVIEQVEYSDDYSDIGHSNALGRARVRPAEQEVVLATDTHAVIIFAYTVDISVHSRVGQETAVGIVQDLMNKHLNPRSTSLQTLTTNSASKIAGKTLVATSRLVDLDREDPNTPRLTYLVTVKTNTIL